MPGKTIALFGDTGSGKTPQFGELAKDVFKRTGKKSFLAAADLGGTDSIAPLIRAGIVIPSYMEQNEDPWIWINGLSTGKGIPSEEIGLIGFDSGTSMGEGLLNYIAKDAKQFGQQKTQRFTVSSGNQTLTVGANNESHYGLVQNFLLDCIWRSTWLTLKGYDILWTFGLDRSEKQDSTPVLGPKLAGHALTSSIPKWFNYCFRLVSLPVSGAPARHMLYLQEQPDMNGMGMSFGNSRYPLDAQTPLPAVIEPASIVEAFRLIELGQAEADAALAAELGL